MIPLSFLSRASRVRPGTGRFMDLAGAAVCAVGLAAGTSLSVRADSLQPASTPYRRSVTPAGNSHSPVFSTDGRFVAFVSHANNLVTNDDLGPSLDLFTRDMV